MVLHRRQYLKPCFVFIRHAHTHSEIGINHYKTLGLSPSATKAEIKAAYYELSKKHHPDRNKNSPESAKIFRLIREAYEILGNERKRMVYDKERIFKFVRTPVMNYPPDNNPDYKDEAERIHFQSKARKPFRRYSFGRTTYYDFDMWYDCHYGKQEKNNFYYKEPKQFKYNYCKEQAEEELQLYPKIKPAMLFFFSLMCILTSISWLNEKKR